MAFQTHTTLLSQADLFQAFTRHFKPVHKSFAWYTDPSDPHYSDPSDNIDRDLIFQTNFGLKSVRSNHDLFSDQLWSRATNHGLFSAFP